MVQPLENAKEYLTIWKRSGQRTFDVRSESDVADGANAVGALCEKVCRRRRAGTEALDQPIRAFKPGALLPGEKSGNGAAHGSTDCRFLKPDTVTFFRRTP